MKKIRKFFLFDISKQPKLIICLTIVALGVLIVTLLLTGCWSEQNLYSDVGPKWSPDGSKIAFSSMNNIENFDIWVMNADGSNQINLTGD